MSEQDDDMFLAHDSDYGYEFFSKFEDAKAFLIDLQQKDEYISEAFENGDCFIATITHVSAIKQNGDGTFSTEIVEHQHSELTAIRARVKELEDALNCDGCRYNGIRNCFACDECKRQKRDDNYTKQKGGE